MLLILLLKLEINPNTKNYEMAFDTSIEKVILTENSNKKIDTFLESKGYYKHYYHAFHPVWGDTLYLKS